METKILCLKPELKHTVAECVLPWDGKKVTVLSWRPMLSGSNMAILFPDDKLMGFVIECSADLPKSELHDV